jgi:hypothetical protein
MHYKCISIVLIVYVRIDITSYPDPREHRTFANIRYALYGEINRAYVNFYIFL